MKRTAALIVAVISLGMLASPSPASAGPEGIVAQLNGFEETPATLLVGGTGVFNALISTDESRIDYLIFYTDVTGTPTAAHIHFGKPGEGGGVAAFLCGGDKPPCPASGTELRDVIVAANVQAIPAQGLEAGDLGGLIRAIKRGFAYVNVHTPDHAGGELRGQIKGEAR
jgi:hypothetical protein